MGVVPEPYCWDTCSISHFAPKKQAVATPYGVTISVQN
jgi:hypothetical protein